MREGWMDVSCLASLFGLWRPVQLGFLVVVLPLPVLVLALALALDLVLYKSDDTCVHARSALRLRSTAGSPAKPSKLLPVFINNNKKNNKDKIIRIVIQQIQYQIRTHINLHVYLHTSYTHTHSYIYIFTHYQVSVLGEIGQGSPLLLVPLLVASLGTGISMDPQPSSYSPTRAAAPHPSYVAPSSWLLRGPSIYMHLHASTCIVMHPSIH
jgi:hypothetical protein